MGLKREFCLKFVTILGVNKNSLYCGVELVTERDVLTYATVSLLLLCL